MEKGLLEKFDRAWKDTESAVKSLKEKTGKKAVGLLLTDIPHELVHAAGALPVSVLGREVTYQHADKHLQGFACSYSRSVVELAESGELSYLDGLVTPYACDTTRCLDLIFKFMGKFDFYECLRLPRRTSADGMEDYFKVELKRLAGSLASFTGSEVTDDSLAASVKAYNEVRGLLGKLADLAGEGREGISRADYISAVKASMVLPPEESAPLLKEAVSQAEAAKVVKDDKPTVVLAGKVPEPQGLLEALEKAGLRVVEDHLVVGSRWAKGVVPGDDPWAGLVERHKSGLPFAGIWDDRAARSAYLSERVEATGAGGAVFLVQKFCEIAEIDLPGVKQDIEAKGIPFLSIETDHGTSSLEVVRTRLEAFSEMLQSK